MANIYVRRLDNNEIVKTIVVSSSHPRHVEMIVRGLLRNMDTDHFYVDDAETDQPAQGEEEG